MAKPKRVGFHFTVPAEMAPAMERAAKKEFMCISEWLRHVVRNGLRSDTALLPVEPTIISFHKDAK